MAGRWWAAGLFSIYVLGQLDQAARAIGRMCRERSATPFGQLDSAAANMREGVLGLSPSPLSGFVLGQQTVLQRFIHRTQVLTLERPSSPDSGS